MDQDSGHHLGQVPDSRASAAPRASYTQAGGMNIPQAIPTVPSGLRAHVAPSAYAGHVLLDGPLLDALVALIEGPIVTWNEVERCELAIRAIVLHTGCSAIEPPTDGSLTSILEPFDPSLPFSEEDPLISPSLRAELHAAAELPGAHINAAVTHALEHGLARPLSDAQRRDSSLRRGGAVLFRGGSPVEVAVPGMMSVVTESVHRVQRAIRLIAAELGGAGVYWGSATEPTEKVLADTLKLLDKWFDPLEGAELARPRVYLVLPVFLAVVLSRASRRDQILSAIIDLRGELLGAVKDLHDKLTALNAVTNQAEGIKILKEIERYPERIAQLAKAELSVWQWIRHVGPEALGGLVSLASGNAFGLAVSGIKVLNSSAAGVARFNYDVRPSLSDRLYREAKGVRLVEHRPLLEKHLMPGELAALF
ncbi:hypothetical protein [Sorangium sp. So ce887]|uniref:hypothetical protein n=1 Tax=Sorangium sp. So ce887 TaxID=3133324 RepID=UPI003F6248CA